MYETWFAEVFNLEMMIHHSLSLKNFERDEDNPEPPTSEQHSQSLHLCAHQHHSLCVRVWPR